MPGVNRKNMRTVCFVALFKVKEFLNLLLKHSHKTMVKAIKKLFHAKVFLFINPLLRYALLNLNVRI